jgi:hypothetical protein
MREEARLKHLGARRDRLLDEFKAGIWDKEQYRKQVRKLTKEERKSSLSQNPRSSPDWDTDLPSSQGV